jgi:hypothetical protein
MTLDPWHTCPRCGVRYHVRARDRKRFICKDCRLADPEYLRMIAEKLAVKK